MTRSTQRGLLLFGMRRFTHQLSLVVLEFAVPEPYLLRTGNGIWLLRSSTGSIYFTAGHHESSLVLVLEKHELYLIVIEPLAIRVTQTTAVLVVRISGRSGSCNIGIRRTIYLGDFDAIFGKIVSLLISLDTTGEVGFDIAWRW